jgi:hypothetical protein
MRLVQLNANYHEYFNYQIGIAVPTHWHIVAYGQQMQL